MLPKFNISSWEIRIYEIIPGLLAWLVFIIPITFIFVIPKIVAYFIILFELYWFFRAINISKHLIYAYNRLKTSLKTDWYKKLTDSNLPYKNILHVIMLPAYNESIEVLDTSLQALTNLKYDLSKVWVVLTIEERGGEHMKKLGSTLENKYKNFFGRFFYITHPDNISGEAKAKGANITYAAKIVEKEIDAYHIPYEHILVSSIDADSAMHEQLLANYTYKFLTTNNPNTKLFQFIPMYHNNFWDAPAVSRMIATGAAFWAMIESTRQERFRTFATYGMSWKNLKDAEYWDITSIIEDGVQYWRNIFAQRENVGLVEPVYSVVYMDAVLDDTFWGTLKAQYKQLRRWSWGASDLSYIMPLFTRMKCFSFKKKFSYVSQLIENHLTWATVPLLLLFAGQLPLLNQEFQGTVLGSNVPIVTSWILTIALFGMVVAVAISTLLLPNSKKFPRKFTPVTSHIVHIFSFILVPLITIIFGAIPALHSQTQLMFGKRMENFVVTVKKRKSKIEN